MIEIHCRYDELLPIHEVKFHPKNRNNHPKDQIERLAEILKYQGWRYPIKISNLSGCIVSGHGRVLAARHLELETVPVQRQDYENEEQEYADLISDNSIASWSELDLSSINSDIVDLGPDFNIDLLGIKDFIVEPVDKLEPQCDEDESPEAPKIPSSCLGEIYILGNHRLLCGNSTLVDDVEKLLDGEKADMVWTDPPYNVAYEGKTKDALTISNDSMTNESFYQFLFDAYSNMLLGTKPGGAIYVAHADIEGANFRKALVDAGWLFKQCLVWVKNTLVMGRQDYHWRHEPILYGWAPGEAHNWYSDRKQTTVLEFSKPQRNGEHPTMKPIELIEYCINNSCRAGGLVLDLFGGSGSTLIACEKTNRKAALIELDPRYCDVILERWQKYTGRKAHREDGVLWDEIKGE
jgi:DNA modification methylase